MTFLFNVVSLFLLVFPLYTVVGYYVRAGLISNVQKEEAPVSFSGNFDGEPPDVYYIILDMHARSDVLKALYGYDDTWFIGALEQRGFYIASQSTSNYSSTLQSLSSSGRSLLLRRIDTVPPPPTASRWACFCRTTRSCGPSGPMAINWGLFKPTISIPSSGIWIDT
jgi:hypothetical protein